MALFDWLFRRNAVPEPAQRTTKTQVNEALVHDSPTAGYRPPLPAHLFYSWGNGSPSLFQFYYDWWSQMHLHPRVQLAMRTYKSGISGAEICVTSRNLTAQNFAQEQFDRLWQKSLATLQEAYDVGWGGFEVVYRFDDDGRLAFDKLKSFRSQDTKPLFRLEKFYGIRVSNVLGKKHPVDLWAADGVGLAKGFWYAHHATQGRIFGWPQGYGAWKPWRRLGFENGSEDTIDLAVFRFGVQGPTVWFPPGKKNIAEDKRDARDPSNRDLARDFADNAKSGVSTALPSEFDPATGKELWRIEWPKHVIDVDSLINYNGSLEDQIDMGIGVPPEMNDQGEGGGLGYRGREIPLEAFYDGQTTLAQSIVQQFADQVILPLTRWNCGEDVTFDVSVKPIMETRRNRDGGAPGQPGQPVQGQPSPPTPPNDKPGSPIRLSTLTDNPVQVALGDPEAEAIVSVLLRRLASTNRQLVRSIVTALTVHTIFDRWQKVQQLLDEHREVVAKTLADAGLASSLAAMRWVGDRIPTRSTNRFEMVPPSAPPPRFTSADFEDGKPYVRLTMIDESANNLAQRGILTREEFDQLSYEARQTAFTVAGVPSTETLETLRNSLADAVTQGWSQRTWEKNVAEALKVDPFISPAHQETVFRTNVQTAYSKGLDKVLDHPLVGTYFPYEAIDPILDDRCRPHHRALATSGINGTNVYRRDDPTYAIVKPPSGYNCRCGRRPLTIEQAAAAGVEEAAKWQETGKEPTIKAWVSLPANWKDDGFVRMATDAPSKSKKGGWITIGAKLGEDGKKHGGTPVYIENGRITKGHPSLTGKRIDALAEDAEPTTHRKELNQSKNYARSVWAKEARKQGLDPSHLHQLAAEVLAHDKAYADEHNAMLKDARSVLDEFGGKHRMIAAKAKRGGRGEVEEGDQIKGMDEAAEYMKERYPHLFQSGNADDRLFELLNAGNREPMAEEDAYRQAMDHLAERKAQEATAFDFGYNDKTNRDIFGNVLPKQFTSGPKLEQSDMFPGTPGLAVTGSRWMDAAKELASESGQTIEKMEVGQRVMIGGKWHAVKHDGNEWKLIRMATAHAPPGGITIAGQKFEGGEFIPNETLAKASPNEFVAVTDHMLEEKKASDAIEQRLAFHNKVTEMLVSGIDDEPTRALIANRCRHIPVNCMRHIDRNVNRVTHHPTMTAISKEWENRDAGRILKPGQMVAGFYTPSGDVHFDDYDTEGTFCHEITHAVDHNGRFSRNQPWIEAWESEIKSGQLCDYATTNPCEGFAEFGRLVFTSPREAREMFPQCWAFWKGQGLLGYE